MIDAQIGSIKSFPKLLDDRLSDFKVKELLTTGTRELSLASFIPFKVIYSRGITVLGKFISDSAQIKVGPVVLAFKPISSRIGVEGSEGV